MKVAIIMGSTSDLEVMSGAFGVRWSRTGGDTAATLTDPANRWRYSGKEEQAALSAALPLIDYGARMYDPNIARWMSQDPLAEKYYPMSPYTYCEDNPLLFVDMDGRDRKVVRNDKTRTITVSASYRDR